ncbi:Aldehyde dehydrogenase 3 member I1, chloroplastic [Trifolium repens]|nr:Aldehyde dehydrogenase 3 member I1, chloroplastic [Trifolium repens]
MYLVQLAWQLDYKVLSIIDKFYSGSARVGRIVMAAVAKHLTPVILELGGKCPAVVDSDINLQVTARRIIAGKWACNSGQACIFVDYIITRKDFAPTLVRLVP